MNYYPLHKNEFAFLFMELNEPINSHNCHVGAALHLAFLINAASRNVRVFMATLCIIYNNGMATLRNFATRYALDSPGIEPRCGQDLP
jgi:hypothetical protein